MTSAKHARRLAPVLVDSEKAQQAPCQASTITALSSCGHRTSAYCRPCMPIVSPHSWRPCQRLAPRSGMESEGCISSNLETSCHGIQLLHCMHWQQCAPAGAVQLMINKKECSVNRIHGCEGNQDMLEVTSI